MTKREEWDRMIKKVENDDYTTDDILQFLEKNKPKPKESQKRQPCTCGCKLIYIVWNIKRQQFIYQCSECNKRSTGAKTQIQAIRNWNEMIGKEEEKEDASNDA